MEREYKLIESWSIADEYQEIDLNILLTEIAEDEAIRQQKIDKWTIHANRVFDDAELYLNIYRWETDEELKAREQVEENRKIEREKVIENAQKLQEKLEYQEYVRLKEKYEGKR